MEIDLAKHWFVHVGCCRTVRLVEHNSGEGIGLGTGMLIDDLFRIAVIIEWQPQSGTAIRLGDVVSYMSDGSGRQQIVGEPVRLQCYSSQPTGSLGRRDKSCEPSR